MVGPIVLHNVEHWDPVMGGRPQRARAEHEVAVAAERDRETVVLLVGERRAKRGRQRVPDGSATRKAVPLVRLLKVPKPVRPCQPDRGAHQ
jgi:hypothetical protein